MPSRKPLHQYTQLGIGDCGHVVETWPQIGNKVICDDCTKAEYGIDNDEGLVVVVRLKVKAKPKYDETDPDMPQPRTKRAPRPRKPKSVLETLLAQEGLF